MIMHLLLRQIRFLVQVISGTGFLVNWLMSCCNLICAELRLVSFNNARCRSLLKLISVRGPWSLVVSKRTLVEFIYILLLRFEF
jgi:hypothetical protein